MFFVFVLSFCIFASMPVLPPCLFTFLCWFNLKFQWSDEKISDAKHIRSNRSNAMTMSLEMLLTRGEWMFLISRLNHISATLFSKGLGRRMQLDDVDGPCFSSNVLYRSADGTCLCAACSSPELDNVALRD